MNRIRKAVVTCLVLSTVVVMAPPATAAPSATVCESAQHPGYAVYLSAAVDRAAAAAPDSSAIGFYDRVTDTSCYVNPDQKFNTASIVKVLITMGLQWRAQQDGRPLTQAEIDTATTMVTSADAVASNEAANALWTQLQLESGYVQEVLDIMGLVDTALALNGEWGMSETTAREQVIVLRVLTSPDEVFLAPERRQWVLDLMATAVTTGQWWGVPVGTSPNVRVHNKIGYSQLDGGFWDYRTHSAGWVHGPSTTGVDLDYVMAILSDGNPPVWGTARVSAAAAVINLAKAARPA